MQQLLSDFWPHGQVAKRYGVLRSSGITERAIFIIDKKGIIRYIDIYDINIIPKLDILETELKEINLKITRIKKRKEIFI